MILFLLFFTSENAFAFVACDPHERNMNFATELCQGGEKVSVICNAILQFGGPLALLCAAPGSITQIACDLKDRYRKTFQACVAHEEKVAYQRALNAAGHAQRAAYVRPILDKFINDYNNAVNPSWDENAFRIEGIIGQQARMGWSDDETYLKIQEYLKGYDDTRPQVHALAKKKFEEAFFGWKGDISTQGYTEWDSFAQECFQFRDLKNYDTIYCMKASCLDRNWFMTRDHWGRRLCDS